MPQKKKIILLGLGLICFLLITFLVISKNQFTTNFDLFVNYQITKIQSPATASTMSFLTQLGNVYESLLIFIVFSIILIAKRKKTSFYIFAIATGLGSFLPFILKFILARTRPLNSLILATDYSFPSGHATISAVFIFSAILLFAPLIKKAYLKHIWIIAMIVLWLLVALSRIYLSVHWTTDVIAGLLLGSTCYFISSIICCHKKENML